MEVAEEIPRVHMYTWGLHSVLVGKGSRLSFLSFCLITTYMFPVTFCFYHSWVRKDNKGNKPCPWTSSAWWSLLPGLSKHSEILDHECSLEGRATEGEHSSHQMSLLLHGREDAALSLLSRCPFRSPQSRRTFLREVCGLWRARSLLFSKHMKQV